MPLPVLGKQWKNTFGVRHEKLKLWGALGLWVRRDVEILDHVANQAATHLQFSRGRSWEILICDHRPLLLR